MGTIVCFLVAPAGAAQGIARRCSMRPATACARRACAIAEANPRPNAKTPAENHFGPLALYLSAGFTVHREDSDGSVVVRKTL